MRRELLMLAVGSLIDAATILRLYRDDLGPDDKGSELSYWSSEAESVIQQAREAVEEIAMYDSGPPEDDPGEGDRWPTTRP